ncbi:SDR family NAD(P)-dependent oxidoreductase [Dickeya zeae]|jgi:short-subunit dehydrogenase|uniref:SDR family NAD(P)-dependent oxidoreductase n=1 Tax=Dickeya zeae TaxID=204042 RepID=A0AAE6Z0B9_9GAMM|nr:SDR family NAD(P)-dependent oxidoreductase [Dickeya zeae]AUQ24896.1 short-chain dehydrogenase [Dickeya zeae]QIZ51764.1 SDR family NAD(P)-dependent oxidoreductase [Dickeya zeae]UJR53863.1 SDR family NAD(P)-dependent oxidoreductase [Dickeya zeae MS1]UJR57986.1 SDR family NAD(P)-dependent oxidoreductase [Dickeya zeae]UJR62438.1 SDR family NAD(P)-dependent oxidoreductase [Dickeya zeae]
MDSYLNQKISGDKQMEKCVAILGAGPGLGKSLARSYGREGYTIALVARRASTLKIIAEELESEGIATAIFTADFLNQAELVATISAIQNQCGRIETLYYGPNAPEAFVPAFSLHVDEVKAKMDLFFYGLVAAVSTVLPAMRKAGSGTILVGLGGSASQGLPFMSGPGPALAAARNYLYSLHGELAAEGVYVGMLNLSAVIKNSGWETKMKSGDIKLDLPPGFVIPDVEPDFLAELLRQAAKQRQVPELVYPTPR